MDLVHISQVLKAARLKQHMTIERLAKKIRLSKGFISRLENFRITPSLNALNRIALALGLEMADLFQPEASSPKVTFGNLREGEQIERDEGHRFGIDYYSLAYKKLNRQISPFLLTYRPTRKAREFLMHNTEEFYLVLEGQVDFYVYDEAHVRTLKQGDTVYLSKGIPHTARLSPGHTLAQALVVYHEPGDE